MSSSAILFAYEKFSTTGTLDSVEKSMLPEISSSLGGSTAKRFSIDNAVALVWGDVKLEVISPDTIEYDQHNPSEGAIDRQLGLLVNTIGDFKAAKDDHRPLYRVIGGDGLLVIVCERTPKHVVVQRLIVAAGTLSERKFRSQAADFLNRDQNAPATDDSKWPEMALAVRRLALDTTEINANKVIDEFFASARSQKYHSHVWAYLPTSVINHLRDGTYMAFDIFGENTEFPHIREKIVAQLKEHPAEPFSEFLLYTLGRFEEAVRFNQSSPIHTVLTYASAHSKLRQLMATLFRRVAMLDDAEMLSVERTSFLGDLNPENVQFQSAEVISRFQEATKKQEDSQPEKDKSASEINAQLASKDFFHGHAYERIDSSNDYYRDNDPSLTQYISYLNQFPERYSSRPLVEKYPDFTPLTEDLMLQLEEVIKDRSSPHFDDAAYFLGWLQYHRGNLSEALAAFEFAIAPMPKVGTQSAADDAGSDDHNDYAEPAVHQTGRILRTLPPEDALSRVINSKVLSLEPRLWYVALDGLYIGHKDQMVIDGARLALQKFGITVEDLPVTTDPERINDALIKLNADDDYLGDLGEIVYLYNASREAQQLKTVLSNVDTSSPKFVVTNVKATIIKYSLTKDLDSQAQSSTTKRMGPRHKDLRQGIYLAEQSLDLVPKTPVFSTLREWLHYKRITLLALFDPIKVAAANAEFQEEFPKSALLDDGMAEQVFGEAVIIGDMAKATSTFNDLLQKFPTGNAVDNAYSWMAIGWTCSGQPAKARAVNLDIVRLFPTTRHAVYARQRLKKPQQCSDMQGLFNWDYNAMNWRQRTRIDVIQRDLAAHQH